MAKDKAAKKREREKRKKQDKLRAQEHARQRSAKAEQLVTALSYMDAKSVALRWSIDPGALESRGPGALIPPPAHYTEFRAMLHETGLKSVVDAIVRTLQGVDLYSDSSPVGVVIRVCADGSHEVDALPTELMLRSTKCARWLELELEDPSVQCAMWLAWFDFEDDELAIPQIVSMDSARRVTAWFLDGKEWHPATFSDELLKSFDSTDLEFMPSLAHGTDCGLHLALQATGAASTPPSTRFDPDEPRVRQAMEIVRASQTHLLSLLLDFGDEYEESEAAVEEMYERNAALAAVERKNDILTRRLAQVEQERDAATAKVALLSSRPKGTTPAKSIETLSDRLKRIFE